MHSKKSQMIFSTLVVAVVILASVRPSHAGSGDVFAGTLKKVDTDTKTIVVGTADGTEKTAKFTEKTSVHGLKDGVKATDLAGKEGGHVIVHSVDGTAHGVTWVGEKSVHSADGVVDDVGKGSKTVALKSADGSKDTFEVADHAVVGTSKRVTDYSAEGAKKGEHVTVYYTEEGGKKIAHFFRRSF
jgi:hypothetical protein